MSNMRKRYAGVEMTDSGNRPKPSKFVWAVICAFDLMFHLCAHHHRDPYTGRVWRNHAFKSLRRDANDSETMSVYGYCPAYHIRGAAQPALPKFGHRSVLHFESRKLVHKS